MPHPLIKRRRNWSFLRPVPAIWKLATGALFLSLGIHLLLGGLFTYHATPAPHPQDLSVRPSLLTVQPGSAESCQLQLRDPAGVLQSAAPGGYLALLPPRVLGLTSQRPEPPLPAVRQSLTGYTPRFRQESATFSWTPLPPLRRAEEAAEPHTLLVLNDAGKAVRFPETLKLPRGKAPKPTVWFVCRPGGLPHFVLRSSCGEPALDEAARLLLEEVSPETGDYLFYWREGAPS